MAHFVLERFMESSVSFEDFAKEPTQILSNPKLVFRIDDRYSLAGMFGVYFPIVALRSKIFKECEWMSFERCTKTGGRFVYCAKISHHLVILRHLYSVISLEVGNAL